MTRVVFQRVGIISLGVLLVFTAFAQSPSKKKTKDFGSSLKRLRWDGNKKELVVDKLKAVGSELDEGDVIRIESSLVAWDLLVVDQKGKIVRGLTEKDFAIKEDGLPQTVGHFLLGDNQSVPRKIVLIIDYSGSQLPYLRKSIDAAKILVDNLAPLDRMAIVTDDVDLLLDYSNDRQVLKKKLDSLIERTQRTGGFLGLGKNRQLGKSSQYSALMATFNEMFDDQDQRPIIIFQTDGDEIFRLRDAVISDSIPPDIAPETREMLEFQQRVWLEERRTVFSLADVYRTAERSRATVYTVIPGPRLVGTAPELRVRLVTEDTIRSREEMRAQANSQQREELQREEQLLRPLSPINLKAKTSKIYAMQLALAAVSAKAGGWTEYLETPEQASTIYSRILSDINQRYIIGYYPTNKEHDGKRRSIKVEVKGHPEYTIVGRGSYYAPLSQ